MPYKKSNMLQDISGNRVIILRSNPVWEERWCMPQQEERHIYYDRDLNIEAYNLGGIVQRFPNHFHDFYVIGFIDGGSRHLWCRDVEYDLTCGDLILFNPRDNHYCAPVNGEVLDYRAVNIRIEVMERAVEDITGSCFRPHFTQNVVKGSEIAFSVQALYQAIVDRAPRLEREELLYFLLAQILKEFAKPFEEEKILKPSTGIRALCDFMEENLEQNITLDQLASMAELSKYYLLRTFTKQVGVSPYRYLQSVRIERAKGLLEQGVSPLDAAMGTGFSDQSHFTNYFKEFIGVTPKQYQRIFSSAGEDVR